MLYNSNGHNGYLRLEGFRMPRLNWFWWARQDLNLGPTDYEFCKGNRRYMSEG
jgi:hypothetical protein